MVFLKPILCLFIIKAYSHTIMGHGQKISINFPSIKPVALCLRWCYQNQKSIANLNDYKDYFPDINLAPPSKQFLLLFQSAINPILMFNTESHLLQFHLTFSTLTGSFYGSFIFAISRCQANSITEYNSMSLVLSEYLYHTFIFLFKNYSETRPLPLYLKQ